MAISIELSRCFRSHGALDDLMHGIGSKQTDDIGLLSRVDHGRCQQAYHPHAQQQSDRNLDPLICLIATGQPEYGVEIESPMSPKGTPFPAYNLFRALLWRGAQPVGLPDANQ